MADILKDNRRLLVFIILSNFLLNFGFQVWQTLFNNFAVEELAAGPAAVGLIQAVREVHPLNQNLLTEQVDRLIVWLLA